MKRAVLTSVAALMSMSTAFAQSNPNPSAATTANPPANTEPAINQPNKNPASFRQQITSDLQKAGFSNIKVAPEAYVVQANDKSGHPVTMFLSPGEMTVFAEADQTGQAGEANARGPFVHVPAREELSSKVVGLDVYNGANQKIGKIENIAFDQNKLKAYIVGVGGFMGLGEHDVAVSPSAMTVNYDANDKKWHVTTTVTAEQLKAAPDALRLSEQPIQSGQFTSIQSTGDLSSKIVGVSVYNNANQNIGTIKDVAFNASGIKAYIIGVGGVLSLGERYVAVNPSAIALSYNASERTWHAAMQASNDELKAAPQYKYTSNPY